MAHVPFSTADACWCQPFDGPIHENCPVHGAGYKLAVRQALATWFPWLTTGEEQQVSGADTIDELCTLYARVGGTNAPALEETDGN